MHGGCYSSRQIELEMRWFDEMWINESKKEKTKSSPEEEFIN